MLTGFTFPTEFLRLLILPDGVPSLDLEWWSFPKCLICLKSIVLTTQLFALTTALLVFQGFALWVSWKPAWTFRSMFPNRLWGDRNVFVYFLSLNNGLIISRHNIICCTHLPFFLSLHFLCLQFWSESCQTCGRVSLVSVKENLNVSVWPNMVLAAVSEAVNKQTVWNPILYIFFLFIQTHTSNVFLSFFTLCACVLLSAHTHNFEVHPRGSKAELIHGTNCFTQWHLSTQTENENSGLW